MTVVYFLFGIVAFILVSAFLFRIFQKRARRGAWESFASRYGLTFDPGKGVKYPSMSGRYRDRVVSITVEHPKVGGGGPFTRFGAEIKVALPGGLSITPQTMGARMKHAAGSKSILTGHQDVDTMLRVTCPDAETAKQLLDNEPARRAIIQFIGSRLRSEINSARVSFVFDDYEYEDVRLKMGLDVVVDTAEALEKARSGY